MLECRWRKNQRAHKVAKSEVCVASLVTRNPRQAIKLRIHRKAMPSIPEKFRTLQPHNHTHENIKSDLFSKGRIFHCFAKSIRSDMTNKTLKFQPLVPVIKPFEQSSINFEKRSHIFTILFIYLYLRDFESIGVSPPQPQSTRRVRE